MSKVFFIWIIVFILACSSQQLTIVDKTHDSKTHQVTRYLKTNQVNLASPNIEVDSMLFKESALVTMNFDLEESDIKYSIYNNNYQKNYTEPITVGYSTTIKAHTHKNGFIDSAPCEVTLIKVNDKLKDASIKITPSPHDNYKGSGFQSLNDLEKGTLNFRDGNRWLGFQSEEVHIELDWPEAQEINKVLISFLADDGAWIFMPIKISVLYNDQPYAIESYDLAEHHLGYLLTK